MTITAEASISHQSTAAVDELMDELFSWWRSAIKRRDYSAAAVLKDAESTVESLRGSYSPEELIPLCHEIFSELTEQCDLVEEASRKLHGEIAALIGTLAKRHGIELA